MNGKIYGVRMDKEVVAIFKLVKIFIYNFTISGWKVRLVTQMAPVVISLTPPMRRLGPYCQFLSRWTSDTRNLTSIGKKLPGDKNNSVKVFLKESNFKLGKFWRKVFSSKISFSETNQKFLWITKYFYPVKTSQKGFLSNDMSLISRIYVDGSSFKRMLRKVASAGANHLYQPCSLQL